ncbi:glycosyltransferase family 69 protein [Lepidopterella palustris CBS 459.81]|uniref:Glycosyltransferase family 69 protein n=1 Tax=Lepidopterella palustris CBS 459.81 TaxID=1314670 RepID=A0A8E2JGP4_9PEZI|nr:glycosyltransferase family 69 protein [Lepidopterella palustris CBS 459.81]
MFNRRLTALLQVIFLLLVVLSLLVGLSYFTTDSSFGFGRVQSLVHSWPNHGSANDRVGNGSASTVPEKEPSSKWLEDAPAYINAIMNPEDTTFNRLECPTLSGDRYTYLRDNSSNAQGFRVRPKYFFALDLYNCRHILPRLFGSIVEAMRFLGPESCALSVVEGRSTDGTYEVLKLLQPEIENMGAKYILQTNGIDPTGTGVNRIQALADLRNQALQPLVDHPDQFSPDTTVVFLNDIVPCMEDLLELIHQRFYQHADMTCAMDWTYVGKDPTFYDIWIARGMNGDSFFDIPADGNWNSAWNLFWNNPESHDRLMFGKSFQVFSCWNGATAFTAKPFFEHKLKFRSSFEQECYQGEPQLFCKEMWYHGYGKIAVVPTVNVEYNDAAGKKIKDLKGYVSKLVESEQQDDESLHIKWEPNPPENIKCMASYANQTWCHWDEQLAENGVWA